MRHLLPFVAFFALPLTACLQTSDGASDMARVLPDERVQINLPVDVGGSDRARDWSEFYLMTAEVTENVNGLVGSVLFMVDHITSTYEPSWSSSEANTALWGPWAEPLDSAETRLWVHHDEATDIYTWGFDQRLKNDDEAVWSTVIAGQVDAGATEDASSGWFAIDFDTMYELDPTTDAVGAFVCEYDLDEEGVSGTALFDDFGEPGGSDFADAAYHYEQVHGGEGLMDLVRTIDLNPGSGTDEILVIRSRWTQDGEGRADAYATGGDLGEELGTATECWDTSFESVYYTDNYSGTETGDADLCVYEEPDYNESEV